MSDTEGWLKRVKEAAPIIQKEMQKLAQSKVMAMVYFPYDDAEQLAMALEKHGLLASITEAVPTLDRKSAQYVRQSEEAARNIATWPQWMQRNLTPPTVTIPDTLLEDLRAEWERRKLTRRSIMHDVGRVIAEVDDLLGVDR